MGRHELKTQGRAARLLSVSPEGPPPASRARPRWKSTRLILLPLVVLCGLVVTQTGIAQAKLGPVSINSVYTTDQNHNAKTLFVPGDPIYFHVDVENTTGQAMPVDLRVETIPIDAIVGPAFPYDITYHVDSMPAGLSRFYNPTTLPSDTTNGDYMVRITVTPSNSVSPVNDGDWGEADFHVFSTTNINGLNEAISYLQNAALCLSDIVSLGADDLLLTGVSTGASAIGYFKDTATGGTYYAQVQLIPGTSCVKVVLTTLQRI
jgi:hypothetical protein